MPGASSSSSPTSPAPARRRRLTARRRGGPPDRRDLRPRTRRSTAVDAADRLASATTHVAPAGRRARGLDAARARQALAPCRGRQGHGLHAQALARLHALPRRREDLPHQQRRRTSAARRRPRPKVMAVLSAPIAAAQRAAVMYTLIGTAKLNDIDPQAWLADVLERIAGTPASRPTGMRRKPLILLEAMSTCVDPDGVPGIVLRFQLARCLCRSASYGSSYELKSLHVEVSAKSKLWGCGLVSSGSASVPLSKALYTDTPPSYSMTGLGASPGGRTDAWQSPRQYRPASGSHPDRADRPRSLRAAALPQLRSDGGYRSDACDRHPHWPASFAAALPPHTRACEEASGNNPGRRPTRSASTSPSRCPATRTMSVSTAATG